jgi:antitoxin VapB
MIRHIRGACSGGLGGSGYSVGASNGAAIRRPGGFPFFFDLRSIDQRREQQPMKTATVTTPGDGQSVHLPAEVRLEDGEVFVIQVGHSVVLVPRKVGPWQSLFDSLQHFTEDYLEDRVQAEVQAGEDVYR